MGVCVYDFCLYICMYMHTTIHLICTKPIIITHVPFVAQFIRRNQLIWVTIPTNTFCTPLKFNSSPLKSYRNPIGKRSSNGPTTIFQGRTVKLQGSSGWMVYQPCSGNCHANLNIPAAQEMRSSGRPNLIITPLGQAGYALPSVVFGMHWSGVQWIPMKYASCLKPELILDIQSQLLRFGIWTSKIYKKKNTVHLRRYSPGCLG